MKLARDGRIILDLDDLSASIISLLKYSKAILKLMSKARRRQKIQPINLPEQEPLIPVTLEEFFPMDFFDKVTINMTSCYEMEDEENGDEERQEQGLEDDDKTLTVLEALPTCIDWTLIFNFPKDVRQHVVVAFQHQKLYADKVKDVGPLMKGISQYAAYNIAITFTDDDLLLGSKPHNHPLFVTSYIKEHKVSVRSA